VTSNTASGWPGRTDRRRSSGIAGRRSLAGVRLREARALRRHQGWAPLGQLELVSIVFPNGRTATTASHPGWTGRQRNLAPIARRLLAEWRMHEGRAGVSAWTWSILGQSDPIMTGLTENVGRAWPQTRLGPLALAACSASSAALSRTAGPALGAFNDSACGAVAPETSSVRTDTGLLWTAGNSSVIRGRPTSPPWSCWCREGGHSSRADKPQRRRRRPGLTASIRPARSERPRELPAARFPRTPHGLALTSRAS